MVHCVTTQAWLEGYNQLDTCLWQRCPPFKSLPSSPIFSFNCDSYCLGCKECNHVKTQFNPFSFWLCGLFLVDKSSQRLWTAVQQWMVKLPSSRSCSLSFPSFLVLHMLAGLCGISKKWWEIRAWILSPFWAVLQSWFLVVS